MDRIENLFAFCDEVFKNDQELLILVTELTANSHTAKFIARYGSPAYFRHNKELMYHERNQAIMRELELLELE